MRTNVAGVHVQVHKDLLAITIMIGAGDADSVVEHLECSTMTDDLRAMVIVRKKRGVLDWPMPYVRLCLQAKAALVGVTWRENVFL